MINITIVGPGAIGLEQAIMLSQLNWVKVTILGKENSIRLKAVKQKGGKVILYPENTIIYSNAINVTDNINDITTPQEYLIISIKSYDFNESFCRNIILPLIKKNPNIKIVFSQNGILPGLITNIQNKFKNNSQNNNLLDDKLANLIGIERIIYMLILRGNCMNEPGVVSSNISALNQKNNVYSIIGSVNDNQSDLDKLKLIFNEARLPSIISQNIIYDLFCKLAINIMGCFCIITKEGFKKTLSNKEILPHITTIINEISQIAKIIGTKSFPSTAEIIEKAIRLENYKPSILYDLENGKNIEYETILLKPYTLGKNLNLELPAFEYLLSNIKSKLISL